MRMHNPALNKTFRLLGHPLVIGSVVLLLLNDHLFRVYDPSPFTGKVSDFCWLLFSPLILAIPLSMVIPGRVHNQQGAVLFSSLSLTGLVFMLANTVTSFRLFLEQLLGAVTRSEFRITQDPTDLVALLSFVLVWQLWQRSEDDKVLYQRPLPYLAIALGITFSLANSAYMSRGIECVNTDATKLIASAGWQDEIYLSNNGGLSWDDCAECASQCVSPSEESLVIHPEDSAIRYRYFPGERIERSEDGGDTSVEHYDLRRFRDARSAFYEYKNSVQLLPGPFSGVIDPTSGNAVFAMGHDGVLVHKANGEWVWVAVGEYGREGRPLPSSPQELVGFLYGEFHLSVLFGLLSIASILVERPFNAGKIVALSLPWFAFFLSWSFRPALNRLGYGGAFAVFLVYSGYFLVLLQILIFSRDHIRLHNLRLFLTILILGFIIFYLPYILWAMTGLSSYFVASIISLVLGLALIALGRRIGPFSRVEG
ncbi:MAG TPA: hypothetical protein G4O11_04840 [Anaerolineae bacterium]|nr:hypothetical protein [Anaerolineae bacterium]